MTQGELKKTRKLPNLYTFMQTDSNSEGNGPRWQTDPENPMLGPNGQLWDACERLQQFVYSPSEALTFIFVITLRMIYPLPSGWMQTSLGQSGSHTRYSQYCIVWANSLPNPCRSVWVITLPCSKPSSPWTRDLKQQSLCRAGLLPQQSTQIPGHWCAEFLDGA